MASFIVLQRAHAREDGIEDVKFIGVYSSHEKAQGAAARLSGLPGFVEDPEGPRSQPRRDPHARRCRGLFGKQ